MSARGINLRGVNIRNLEEFSRLIRYYILISSTEAGSGHPTSSLSATDLMCALLFGHSSSDERVSSAAGGFFRYDLDNPDYPNNDRLIFSKGHASPLFYSLWAAAGKVSPEELLTFRKFGSPLEGHPTPAFPFTEAATGSLGQGLSIGVGMALNAKYVDKLPYRTYVLLGDSEMAEGSVWEAMQIAAHYGLDNLIGILDVNRLGQRGETMYGHDVAAYEKRISSFGWKTYVIDGHSFLEILDAYEKAVGEESNAPRMIIAKTIKGKGVSFIENQDGWHGKVLSKEELQKALGELGAIDKGVRGEIKKPPPEILPPIRANEGIDFETVGTVSSAADKLFDYAKGKPVATRKAYGNALVRIFPKYPNMVVLDAEVSFQKHSKRHTPIDFLKCTLPNRIWWERLWVFLEEGKFRLYPRLRLFLREHLIRLGCRSTRMRTPRLRSGQVSNSAVPTRACRLEKTALRRWDLRIWLCFERFLAARYCTRLMQCQQKNLSKER